MTTGKYLTTKERVRILELVDIGLTTNQIASRFGIASHTVYRVRRWGKKQGRLGNRVKKAA